MIKESSIAHYVIGQLTAKAMAAVAQLYAIFVFSKILLPSDSALIFILLGYGVWVQIFELGLSQYIQNSLNNKSVTVNVASQIISIHYVLMIFIGILIVIFPGTLVLFHGERALNGNATVFSIGIAFLLISTNSVIIQRILLVTKKGFESCKLIFLQGLASVAMLIIFQWQGVSFLLAVVTYLGLPVLIYLPLTIKFFKKSRIYRNKFKFNLRLFFKNSFGFWILSALSSIYMGADYFFAAKYLNNAEIISYHFSSRLFYISYVAYFSYIQFAAKNISINTQNNHVDHIWVVIKKSLSIGLLSVALVLTVAIFLNYFDILNMLGARDGLLVMPLLWSAALYYIARVVRDVGLVIVWNLGFQRFLYAIHAMEVIFCLLLLTLISPYSAGIGIFLAMAIVSLLSSILIYGSLVRLRLKII